MKRLLFLITFIILAVAIDSVAQQADRRNRSITGRVINDSGQPVANASIYLNRVGARPGPGSATGTDEQGNFRADDLDNGAYVVSAFVPGFVSASDTAEPQYHRPGDSVTLQMTKGGVITGAVTTATGEPVVAARIRALRVRELDGRPVRTNSGTQERATDDRGIYRLYGLRSGVYVVLVAGRSMYSFGGPPSLYEGNAPTYYPSSTRDTAVEVTVRAGDEASGIDIRYRGERGHVVSGTVTGAVEGTPQQGGISVTLAHASSGIIETQEFVQFRDKSRSFALYGVPDGEYELSARRGGQSDSVASLPRRLTVKGSDITGLEVLLAPVGSIAGNVIIETMKESERKPECSDKRLSAIEEIVITARRDDKESKERPRAMSRADGSPNDKGEFTLFNLRAGLFRIQPLLPSEGWYVRSMSLIANSTGKSKVVARDAARSGVQLNQGERSSGLTITIAEGAASITGKLLPAKEGRQLPALVRVHLAPAEPELVDDALRYREALAESDGSFRLANLPPGRYLIFAKEATETDLSEDGPRPAAWDAATRVAVKREADAFNQTIELQPCRRITDYSLRVAAATTKPEPLKPEAAKPTVKKP
jgi:hypothetical protein